MKNPILKMAGHDMPKLFQSLYDIGCMRTGYSDSNNGIAAMTKKIKSYPEFVYVLVSSLKYIGFRTQDEYEADLSLTLVNSPHYMITYLKSNKMTRSVV